MNEEVDRYQAVTVEQVNAFIRERLGENNRASLLYVPREEVAGRARRSRRGGGGSMTAPRRQGARARRPGAPREYHFPRFERRRLDERHRARRRAGDEAAARDRRDPESTPAPSAIRRDARERRSSSRS